MNNRDKRGIGEQRTSDGWSGSQNADVHKKRATDQADLVDIQNSTPREHFDLTLANAVSFLRRSESCYHISVSLLWFPLDLPLTRPPNAPIIDNALSEPLTASQDMFSPSTRLQDFYSLQAATGSTESVCTPGPVALDPMISPKPSLLRVRYKRCV